MPNARRRSHVLVAAASITLAAALLWPGDGGETDEATPVFDAVAVAGGGHDEVAARVRAGGIPANPGRRLLPDEGAPEPPDPAFVRALAGFVGRVLEEAAVPAADAEVTILRIDAPALLELADAPPDERARAPRLVAARARTDREGRFRVTGVWPASVYLLRAVQGVRRATTRILARAPGPGQVVDLGDVLLEASASITGTVLDADGRPIAGATARAAAIPDHLLRAWPLERFDPELPLLYLNGDQSHVFEVPVWLRERLAELGVVTARSDELGRFRLEGVPTGEVATLVGAPGQVPLLRAATRVTAGTATELGSLVLERGLTVHGSVLDEHGAPLPGAEVLIGQGTAAVPVVSGTRAGTSDALGRFAASGFRNGHVVAAARRGPDEPWVVTRPQPADSVLAVRLPGSCTLTVLVRAGAGHAVEPRIELLPAVPDGPDLDLARLGFVAPTPLQRKLARIGEGHYRLRDVQKGCYVLTVAAPGHAVRVRPIRLEGDTQVVFDLAGEQPFEVLVSDAEGRPVANATVSVQAWGEHPRIPRLPVPCGRTDGNGRLLVTQATSNRVRVRASHPAWGFVDEEVALPVASMHLQLRATGTITGVLSEAGERPAPGKWNLALRLLEPPDDGMFQLSRLEEAGEDSRFEFQGLRPGTYELSVIEAAGPVGLGMVLDPATLARRFTSRERHTRVPVDAGRTTHVQIDAKGVDPGAAAQGSRVAGMVTINGQPAKGLEVRGWHGRWLSGQVGSDGRFDLGLVPHGDVGLYVVDPVATLQGRWEVLWWRRVRVRPEQEELLDIDLHFGSIAGVVRGPDGTPVAGCQVKLSGTSAAPGGRDSHTKVYVVTDRDGCFLFDSVPAGAYEASVWHQRQGRGSAREIVVRAGQRTAGITLSLSRLVSLSGRVAPEGFGPQPPQWSWLRLYGRDESGRYLSAERGCKVRSDGTFLLEGVPPGRYEVSIGAMFRAPGRELAWDTRMFVHDQILEVGAKDLQDLVLRPAPQPERAATRKNG